MKTLRVQIMYHTDKQDSFFLMTRAYYSRVNILKVSLLIGVLFIRCVQVAVVTKSTTSRKQRVGRLRSSRLGFLLSLSLFLFLFWLEELFSTTECAITRCFKSRRGR